MCKVSVIIPVYNASESLHRCVDSVLAQTFHPFEIILVDDGSTDGSEAICDEYAQANARVRVIHKENGGVSMARQTGIDAANGTYSIHVDADDWIEPMMLEKMYAKAVETDADMVTANYILELPHKTKTMRQQPQSLNANVLLRQYIKGEFHAALWNKLVRTSCYKGVAFPRRINYGEDLYVVGTMLINGNIEHVEYVPKAFYHYDNTGGGNITGRTSKTILKAQIFLTDYFAGLLDEDNYADELLALRMNAKRIALEVGCYDSRTFKSLYSHINGRAKVEYGKMSFVPSLSMVVAIRWSYVTGRYLLRMWNSLLRFMTKR